MKQRSMAITKQTTTQWLRQQQAQCQTMGWAQQQPYSVVTKVLVLEAARGSRRTVVLLHLAMATAGRCASGRSAAAHDTMAQRAVAMA